MMVRKGQSTLEYVIILAAIIAAVIIGKQYIGRAVEQNLTDVETSMRSATSKLPGVE